ncbi:MAG: TIM barrel protein [Anaerolineae bacterium]
MLAARSIRVAAGDDNPGLLERIVPWLRRAAAYTEARGVVMGVETHGGGINGNPRLLAELADKVGSPCVGALHDPCNRRASLRSAWERRKVRRDGPTVCELRGASVLPGTGRQRAAGRLP